MPEPGGEIILRTEGLNKEFKGFVAVANVDLAVRRGTIHALIGPNGAGKTTVLKLAAGVTAPTRGRIRRSKRSLAVIELGAGIHTDLTGRENIELLMSLTMDRSMRTQARFNDIVGFSELGPVLDQPTRFYSSGMVARLAFSVAAHAEPDLLLIESGGDNLAADFSRELADYTIYVIDVAGGDKVPRKGGPGITQSDLLVINKTDLAPAVGADLGVMDRDARKMRGDGPTVFAQIRNGEGVAQIIDHLLSARQATVSPATGAA